MIENYEFVADSIIPDSIVIDNSILDNSVVENNVASLTPENVKQQASDMLVTANNFRSVCETLASTFESIGNALATADKSNLPQEVLECGYRYSVLASKSYTLFEDFATRMNNWADTTISFQEGTASKIDELANQLGDIVSALGSIQ